MPKRCYQCERDNTADQAFCGGCGAALGLNDYICEKVEEQLRDAIRDRDILETESSIKVFERAWGWRLDCQSSWKPPFNPLMAKEHLR
jgi:predicted amidophosphoribosyltransferase